MKGAPVVLLFRGCAVATLEGAGHSSLYLDTIKERKGTQIISFVESQSLLLLDDDKSDSPKKGKRRGNGRLHRLGKYVTECI